eukprot:1074618-Prymnesium_polylepis.1
MDDGATCNIRTTAQGRVPNTYRAANGPLSIGDSGASPRCRAAVVRHIPVMRRPASTPMATSMTELSGA